MGMKIRGYLVIDQKGEVRYRKTPGGGYGETVVIIDITLPDPPPPPVVTVVMPQEGVPTAHVDIGGEYGVNWAIAAGYLVPHRINESSEVEYDVTDECIRRLLRDGYQNTCEFLDAHGMRSLRLNHYGEAGLSVWEQIDTIKKQLEEEAVAAQ